MSSNSASQAVASSLSRDVKERLIGTLSKMVLDWIAEPAADLRRVARPIDGGSFSISIEPYQGVQSWINFREKYASGREFEALDKLLRERQPELLGYVVHDGGSQRIENCFALCSFFAMEAARRTKEAGSPENAVVSLISDLETLLTARTARREVLTLLAGLKLPEGVQRVSFSAGVYIRLLSTDEIAELGSNDISSASRYDLTSRFVTAALITETQASISLSPQHNPVKTPSGQQAPQEEINRVLGALHILKSGRVGVLASFTKLFPTILPNMSGHSSAPLVINPFSFMELTQEDVNRLVTFYVALADPHRDELDIAVGRLVDAETRLSPVDALLDAVIGLEVLLNPNDRSELSFRVALNYAYLGPAHERRRRYENVRDVQVTRNRVVHGGLNLKSKDAPRLLEHAELARTCLRDAVIRFLTDEELMGTQKLDSDFWLDRVLPPQVDGDVH